MDFKSKFRYSVLVFFCLLAAGCGFNKTFLHPPTVPDGPYKMRYGKDSLEVNFDKARQFQPSFTRNGKDAQDPEILIESVVFTNSKGNKLNGWMLKPKNRTADLTLLHLNGNASFVPGYFLLMEKLVKQGFQVFLFDYSGFGFSKGKATRSNVRRDAVAALKFIKNRSDVKGKPLVLYGQSLGGHLAAAVAPGFEKDIDGLVVEGAFTSHHDIAATKGGVFGRILVREMYSGKRSISKFKKPVLVIHSTDDRTIPIAMGKELYARAREPKQFYEIRKCHICGPLYYADSIAFKIRGMVK